MKVIEKRRYPRKFLNARVRVIIFSQALNLMEEGSAKITNISPGGASISNLEIPSQTIPTVPFVVGLSIEEGLLKGIQTTCSMTRFSNPCRDSFKRQSRRDNNGRISMGLRFDRIGEKHQAILWNFIRSTTYRYSNNLIT